MKRIQHDRYGGPETMQLADFELAEPGAAQVAVKVQFASIQPIDWKLRRGDLKILTGRSFPRGMGSDFSGTVLAVGAGVSRLKPGDAVFGMARLKESGAFAEAVVTSETFVARKPPDVSFEQAACLSTAGVMAWMGLIDKAHLVAGQRVFVNGCTGAVSTRNRNVPVLNEIEMSPGGGRWALCETRRRVLQGAVGASARPRRRQRP